MSDRRNNRATLRLHGEERAFEINRPASREHQLLEELRFVRRAAQAEANRAYNEWTSAPSDRTYVVYRRRRIAPTPRRINLPNGPGEPPRRAARPRSSHRGPSR